jgi:hypothetical protein
VRATSRATLATAAPIHLTPEELQSVPFVPASTWDWVKLDGDTPATIQLAQAADKTFTYHLDLAPTNTRLTIPPIDLTTVNTSGQVHIDGPKITLTNVTGHTADGTIHVDSVLNFGPEPADLTFNVQAKQLDVRKLPKSWELPNLEQGQLNGHAKLDIKVPVKGPVQPWGRGDVVIKNVKFAGGTGEIELALVGNGKRLRFSQPEKTSHAPVSRESESSVKTPPAFDSVSRLTGALLAVLLQPPAPPAVSKATERPTYVQTHIKLRDVDLSQLTKQLKLDLPIKVTGRVTLDVAAEIPIAQPRNLAAYRIQGTVSTPALGLQDLTIQQLTANINLRDGVLTLTKLAGAIPTPAGAPGTFLGTARFGVEPRTDLVADLTLDRIPLGQVFAAVPEMSGMASGPLSGTFHFRAPGKTLDDVTTYVADGKLTSPGVTVAGRRAEKLSVVLALAKGVARISEASTVLEGLPVAGSAALTITGQYPFTAHVRTQPTDVAALGKLIPSETLPIPIHGKLAADVEAKGTLSPLAVTTSGTATATSLTAGTAKFNKVSLAWTTSPDEVVLKDVRAEVYKGSLAGSARIPLTGKQPGGFDVVFKNVDATTLTQAIPSFPVPIQGRVTGELKGTIPAGKQQSGAAPLATASLNLTAPELRVKGIPTQKLKGKVNLKGNELGYDLTGELLGGTFDINGTWPLAGPSKEKKPAAPPAEKQSSGRLDLRNINLSRLAIALRMPALAPLRGVVNLSAKYSFDAQGRGPFGGGELEVRDLGWGPSADSTVRAAIKVTPEAIEVVNLGGRLAHGTLRGRARYNLTKAGGGFYTLTLDGADASKLLAPAGLGLSDGRLSLNIRGRLARQITGHGTVTVERSKITSFNLAELRIPFALTYSPGSGGKLTIRDAGGRAVGGRLNGQATVAWGYTTVVEGNLKFINVSMRALLGSYGSSSGLGSSQMNGQFRFSGTNMRSLNDLNGQVVATIGEGPVFDLPVFSQIAQILIPTVSARGLISFNQGDLRARLAKGAFRVEQFALTGPRAKLFMNGTVGLNGRLDLDVIAQTGQLGIDPRLLKLIGVRIPAFGPIPVSLILEITAFLSNRTVQGTVTGTIQQPIVRVNLARLLSEEAIRFFLSPYLPYPLAR